jgi:hypothetical protein
MKHVALWMTCAVLVAGCGDGKKEAAEQLARMEQDSTRTTVVPLAEYDMPVAVELDMQLLQADTPRVRWNEEFGRVEVEAGPRFHITISEEEGDLQRVKADLDRDMLRRNTIVEDSADHLIFRSEFPDDSIVFVHFYRIIRLGGRSFVVESHDQGRFTEADIRRMVEAVQVAVVS